MRGAWRYGLVLAVGLTLAVPQPGRAQKTDAAKDVYLQTIGLLAGQGLVLGHENLAGIAIRYDKRQLTKEKALLHLAIAARYTDLTLETFEKRLMGQLDSAGQNDLKLLIKFYEAQKDAVAALTAYVRSGGTKNRQAFLEMQNKVAAIIRQIMLPAAK